jgi:hypothetical protein
MAEVEATKTNDTPVSKATEQTLVETSAGKASEPVVAAELKDSTGGAADKGLEVVGNGSVESEPKAKESVVTGKEAQDTKPHNGNRTGNYNKRPYDRDWKNSKLKNIKFDPSTQSITDDPAKIRAQVRCEIEVSSHTLLTGE